MSITSLFSPLIEKTSFYKRLQQERKLAKQIEELAEKVKQVEQQRSLAISRKERVEQELVELKERIPAIAEKLANVSVQRSSGDFPRLRVVVELDSHYIFGGLLHGNDDKMINYLGEDIGRRAAYEMKRLNFERWEK